MGEDGGSFVLSDLYDVVIIGAGFAGGATAYHLTRLGNLKVLLLERESCFGVHASGRNAAMLRQAVFNPRIASLVQETLKTLKNSPSDWEGENLFRQTGSFLLGAEDKILYLRNLLLSLGAEAEIYSHGEFPDVTPDWLQKRLRDSLYPMLLYSPQDGVVDVHCFLANLLKSSQRAGLELRYNSPVQKIIPHHDHWVVECEEEIYETSVVVNAAGAWAGTVGELAKLSSPEMNPFRRHLYISEPLSWVKPDSPYVWNIEHEFYFRPESSGLLMCPGDEELHPPEEPQTDPKILEMLAKKFQKHFPPLKDLSILRGWACLRTKTKNGQFKIGWDSNSAGFFWVAGLGGHGVSASLGIGREATCQIFDYFNLDQESSKEVTPIPIRCR